VGAERSSARAIRRSDEVRLRQLVGAATLARGRAYAATGAVRSVEWDATGGVISGEVAGHASRPYQVSAAITVGSSGELRDLAARCSCPVGYNCKHAVALLLSESVEAAPRLRLVSSTTGPARTDPSRPRERSTGAPSPPAKTTPAGKSRSAGSAGPAVGDGAVSPALAAEALDAGRPVRRPARRRDGSHWESALGALLGSGSSVRARSGPPGADPGGGACVGEVALQLEVVAERPTRRGQVRTAGPGIRLRPVVRSAAGNWVRTGIAWSSLDYFAYGRRLPAGSTERIGLLQELRALAGLGGSRVFVGAGDEVVWLETIASRRVWDLLGQAVESGLPLVGVGRDAPPVTVAARPGAAVVDLVAAGTGLVARPRLIVDEEAVDLGCAVLIGEPAHGVAWWTEELVANRPSTLRLAPLSPPLGAETVELLGVRRIDVPASDVDRFLAEAYPVLARRLQVRSSDGSVDLPELVPDVVVLGVAHLGDSAVELSWSVRTAAGAERALADAPGSLTGVLVAACGALGGHPTTVVWTPWGPRPAPTVHLAGMAAVSFVVEALPALEQLDGLVVEESGARPDYREVTEAPVIRLGGGETPAGDWFDLLVEVEVGGEEVPFAELFAALAEGREHLLLPSGTYFSLDRPELRQLAELIEEARSLTDSPPGRLRLGRFNASLWEDLERLGVLDAGAEAWSASLASLAAAGTAADPAPVPIPAGLRATLRPYQHDGFQWLAARFGHRLGGVLADDMGLGKTLQALALVCHARETGLAEDPFLVVAPTSVVANWVSEAARFAPDLPAVAITETARRRGLSLAEVAAGAGLVVTSYALFRLEYDDYEALPWTGLFLDEAQFAKNPASLAYQRARRLPVAWKLSMTGTPLENSLAELWAVTSLAAPGLFAKPDRFAETYRVPIERHGDAERLEQLRRRLRPVMLRRTKAAVAADLPEKQERVLELDLEPRHRKLYQTYLARERQKVLGLLGDLDGNRFEVLRSLTLLRQAALDVSLVDPAHASVPATKLDALVELVAESVADGHRLLVFSQFTRFLTAARQRVERAGVDCCYLDGKTRRRAEVIARFRSGAAPVFLISLKAGGVGLTLTEADHCVLLDPWWNPATETQAVDRAHRIGQTRKVMVHRLVAKDTIEEKVMALKQKKAQLFASVVDGGGFESAALTAADIAELLS